MDNREAWCADKLSKLLNEDLRISTLSEIKEHFSAISQDEAYQTAHALQLPLVFDCLNDSKAEQIDLACEVLSLCMTSLSLGESTNRYGTSLERSLYHPSSTVKLMALKEIHRTAMNPESISELAQRTPIIIALIMCVSEDDLAVAQKASSILTLIGKNRLGLQQLLSPDVRRAFAETIGASEIIRFRVYEIIINIAKDSEEALNNIVTTGLISSLISELETQDILLKLNVIELLSALALCTHGMMYLQGAGVINKIFTQLATIHQDPLASLVIPGLLKFFGNIAHWKPVDVYTQYPYTFNVLFDILKSSDLSTLGVAYDTLGHIAETNEGKSTLQCLGQKMLEYMQIMSRQLTSLPTELRVRGLNCIESLLRMPANNQNNRICNIVQNWFLALSDDPLNFVMKYVQNPFCEIRLAGLGIIQAVSEQNWGQEMVKIYPGLIEFLLDRRIETTKEAKEIKYEIVRSLSYSPVFSEDLLRRMQQFVIEGPFYVQAITEVAIEGSF